MCQGSVTSVWCYSWFCDRALILLSCLGFMWARGFECARPVRSLVCVPCFVLERGVRIPALMSWASVTWRGSDTRAPRSVSLCSLAACFHVVISCVITWLMSFLISCMFVSCFAHGWWFVCWPCACVLFCVSTWLLSWFSVCHVLSCQFVLTPPILLPVYWLIFPSCFPSLPSSFAPFIISLCLQFRVGSLPYVSSSSCVLSCPVLSCPVLSCPVLSCPVLSCPVLSCPVLSCPVLSCPVLSCPVRQSSPVQSSLFFPYGVVFVCLFYFCVK